MTNPDQNKKAIVLIEPPQFVTVFIQNNDKTEIKKFKMRKGTNLWFQLRKNGLSIGSACSGVGVCAACDVEIEILNPDQPLSEETELEVNSKVRNGVSPQKRLACMVRIWSDVVVRSKGFC